MIEDQIRAELNRRLLYVNDINDHVVRERVTARIKAALLNPIEELERTIAFYTELAELRNTVKL